MLYSPTKNDLLDINEELLQICPKFGLKVSIKKLNFYLKNVRWYGHIIVGQGMKLDLENIEEIRNIDQTHTASELSEFVHRLQWTEPVFTISQDGANRFGGYWERHTRNPAEDKKSIKRIMLEDLSWDEEQFQLFHEIQKELYEFVKLSHRHRQLELCIYADASDEVWTVVITQCVEAMVKRAIEKKAHQTLAFLVGKVKGHQENWTTFEKEAFSIFHLFKKLGYILFLEDNTHIFTDHLNLLFIFNPPAINSPMGSPVIFKVQRGGLFLSGSS